MFMQGTGGNIACDGANGLSEHAGAEDGSQAVCCNGLIDLEKGAFTGRIDLEIQPSLKRLRSSPAVNEVLVLFDPVPDSFGYVALTSGLDGQLELA